MPLWHAIPGRQRSTLPLVCDTCGGSMRILAVLPAGETSRAILEHLGGGVDLRAGPGFVVGEVRVVYSGLDNLLAGGSNAGNLVVATAYRLVF